MKKLMIRWQPFFLIACVFVIPVSVSLKSIFLPLAILYNILSVDNRRRWIEALKQPLVISTLLLLIWCLLSVLWAPPAWPETKAVISKMAKLIVLPLFAVGFLHYKTRQYSQYAFLAAVTLTAIISLFMAVSGYAFKGHMDPGNVFNDRIMTGLLISMGAWLAAHFAVKSSKKTRLLFILIFVVCTCQIVFANSGRTGYVVYVLSAICFSSLHLSFRQTLAMMLALTAFAIFAYLINPKLAGTVNLTVYNVKHLSEGANHTSIGFRVLFHQFAQKLFWQHPWFGTGAGSFSWHYFQLQPTPFYSSRLFEPHSQYWLIMVEQGLVGLVLLMSMFLSMAWLIVQVKQCRMILLLALVAIGASCLSDSMLLYSTTGYLLMIISAMALGEQMETLHNEALAQSSLPLQQWQAL